MGFVGVVFVVMDDIGVEVIVFDAIFFVVSVGVFFVGTVFMVAFIEVGIFFVGDNEE